MVWSDERCRYLMQGNWLKWRGRVHDLIALENSQQQVCHELRPCVMTTCISGNGMGRFTTLRCTSCLYCCNSKRTHEEVRYAATHLETAPRVSSVGWQKLLLAATARRMPCCTASSLMPMLALIP